MCVGVCECVCVCVCVCVSVCGCGLSTHESSGVNSRGSTTNWGSKFEGSLSESILGLNGGVICRSFIYEHKIITVTFEHHMTD